MAFDLSTTTLGDLLADPRVVAILEQHAPGLTTNPMIGMVKGLNALQALELGRGIIGAENADKIKAAVAALG